MLACLLFSAFLSVVVCQVVLRDPGRLVTDFQQELPLEEVKCHVDAPAYGASVVSLARLRLSLKCSSIGLKPRDEICSLHC